MWTQERLRSIALGDSVQKALGDKDAALRRNAANIIEAVGQPFSKTSTQLLSRPVDDADGQVRVAALRALAAGDLDPFGAEAIVAAWPKFDDDFQRSAAVAAASRNPATVIAAALDSANASSLVPLVNALTQNVSAEAAGKLVIALADKPASVDALKRSALEGITRSLKETPAMTPELSAALGKLLGSGASGAVLPLAAKWDKGGALKPQVTKLTNDLLAALVEAKTTDDARLSAAQSLLGLRRTNAQILPTVIAELGKDGGPGFKRALIGALGETDDASVGAALAAAYAKLPTDVQPAAFDAVLKRADWTNAFLDAVQTKKIDTTTLGPANAFRLRAHPDKAVAKRATAMLDELNPQVKAKKDLVAKLLPIAEQKGDAEHGKQLFTTTCTICHNFHGVGADIGPGLTGMGAHGAEELLVAIVDPNAEVDPSFVQWNIETKDGQAYAGVIAAENPTSITLKSLAGVQQVKTADIKSRVNTGRSLMPEGFDGLGGEALRDIITYLQSVDGGQFRVVDLRGAFTASTSGGLYVSQENKRDTFEFAKSGTVNVDGVPFSIVTPEKAAGAANILVLKGGPEKSFAKSLPQKVEVKVGGFKANRLHFLGGVTGWGYNGKNSDNEDVLRITVHTLQGQRETLFCKNGVEFADYIRRIDVPGSKYAEGIVKNHQLREFTKQLSGPLDIDHITIESFDTHAAPTIVAITAELADASMQRPLRKTTTSV